MKFFPRENPDGYWQPAIDEIPFAREGQLKGSVNVFEARLLGLSYPDFIQYCRANHHGALQGRAGYSHCVYKDKSDCQAICKILNEQWNKIEKFLKEKN